MSSTLVSNIIIPSIDHINHTISHTFDSGIFLAMVNTVMKHPGCRTTNLDAHMTSKWRARVLARMFSSYCALGTYASGRKGSSVERACCRVARFGLIAHKKMCHPLVASRIYAITSPRRGHFVGACERLHVEVLGMNDPNAEVPQEANWQDDYNAALARNSNAVNFLTSLDPTIERN